MDKETENIDVDASPESSDKGDWSKDWSDVIKKVGDEEEKRNEEFRASIRDPDLVVEIKENNDVGSIATYGYWRVEDGIVVLRKFSNGYHPWNNRTDYPDAEIKRIVELSSVKPIPMKKEE